MHVFKETLLFWHIRTRVLAPKFVNFETNGLDWLTEYDDETMDMDILQAEARRRSLVTEGKSRNQLLRKHDKTSKRRQNKKKERERDRMKPKAHSSTLEMTHPFISAQFFDTRNTCYSAPEPGFFGNFWFQTRKIPLQ